MLHAESRLRVRYAISEYDSRFEEILEAESPTRLITKWETLLRTRQFLFHR